MIRLTDSFDESAVVFSCGNDELVGIHHTGNVQNHVGVLFVVGGRQYRAGAHRQFTLLARELCSDGYPTFRFDVRGMGDSTGDQRHFLELDRDIACALDAFKKRSPQLKSVVLWGLCDGASAAIISARSNSIVDAVLMVNPWISTSNTAAKIQLKHYYGGRVLSDQFWRKILSGKINWVTSLASFLSTLGKSFNSSVREPSSALPDIVFNAVERFSGKVNIIISDHDMTAREFDEAYISREKQNNLKTENTRIQYVSADHTFSTPDQHQQLLELTLEFIHSVHQSNQ